MEHLVNLVGHLVWPIVVAAFAFGYRRQLGDVVAAIAGKIRDPHTGVAFGPSGLQVGPSTEITQRAASQEPAIGLLAAKIRSDPRIEVRLRDWMKDRGINVSVTTFLYGKDFASLRLAANEELLNVDTSSSKEG